MTIAAGFVVRDGVLICADTEHSAGGLLTHGPKVLPVDIESGKVIFTSAGNADLAIAAIQKCVRAIRTGRFDSADSVADRIEQIVKKEYREHAFVAGSTESTYQLLIAIWCERERNASLYVTWQGSIRRSDRYECLGSGWYLGRYIIDSMTADIANLMTAKIVAARTLSVAKRYVDGCGGASHYASLNHDGELLGSAGINEFATDGFWLHANALLFSLLTRDDYGFALDLRAFVNAMKLLRIQTGSTDKSREANHGSAIHGPIQTGQQDPEPSTDDLSAPPPSLESSEDSDES